MNDGMKPISVTKLAIIDDYDTPNSTIRIKCFLGTNEDIVIGDTVVVRYSETFLTRSGDEYDEVIYKEFAVVSADDEDLSFVIMGDSKSQILGQSAAIRTEWQTNEDDISENVDYIYFYFLEPHHFVEGDETVNMIIFVDDIAVNCEYVDDFTLKARKNENIKAYNTLFYSEESRMLKYITLSGVTITRIQFFFDQNNIEQVTFTINRQIFSIRLPLLSTFTTDTFREIDINSKFVKAETQKTITGFNDLEKDVYYPSINKNGVIELVNKIRINMHFRKHRGEEWIVENGATWNGVYVESNLNKDRYKLMNASNNIDNGFFSYSINERDKQSDLLFYLGFTDADIKYRHNRLTKSFIRILFYDSTDIRKQNLLAYSTVFFDVNELYSKFVKNVNNNDVIYSKIDTLMNEDKSEPKNTFQNLAGIRVDREPYWDLSSDRPINVDDIEQYRLSSQIVIKDKYNSTKSSEGFYLYLWKDNYKGEVEQDIYMRIEFNHAGFGRMIPFMLPFNQQGKRMKSFNEIATEDWRPYYEGETEEEPLTTHSYNIEEYQKYSYIHFKYKFDRELNKHVYYLDTDTYGNDAKFDDGAITLNLYEANVV